jgi:hypothetical protein
VDDKKQAAWDMPVCTGDYWTSNREYCPGELAPASNDCGGVTEGGSGVHGSAFKYELRKSRKAMKEFRKDTGTKSAGSRKEAGSWLEDNPRQLGKGWVRLVGPTPLKSRL